MLNDVWPQTVLLAPLAIAILRVFAGLYLVYVAYILVERDGAFSHIQFPLIGRPSPYLIWISGFITAFIGLALIAGFFTQVMAIGGMIVATKHLYLARSHPYIFPLSIGSYTLLLAICFAVFICGTGAFGFDLGI